MKSVKFPLLFLATSILLSCSKPAEDEGDSCENNNTTKVTYVNSTSASLKVVVSTRLTPQFEPIDPIFSITLAAGQSVTKEFKAEKYINTWYNNCASTCNRMTSIFKEYTSCMEYEEKQ